MGQASPIVSVVIPTYRRPVLLRTAVESACRQTVSDIEIVVVSDGPSDESRKSVESISDGRVRYFESSAHRGLGATRNAGVRHSRGAWIAWLDDDDSWAPGKLELQLARADDAKGEAIVVAGMVEGHYRDGARELRPNRFPSEGETIGDYAFGLKGYTRRGHLHASTLMARRWLFENVPFDESLVDHEDFKWIIEVGFRYQARPVMVPEVVAFRRLETGGSTRPGGFRYSKSWYDSVAPMLSGRARGGIVATLLSGKAAHDGEFRFLPWLLAQLARNGALTAPHVVNLLAPWLLGTRLRNALKKRVFRPKPPLAAVSSRR
jgi:glycosyltransferase involved in cell wall biosynthesis